MASNSHGSHTTLAFVPVSTNNVLNRPASLLESLNYIFLWGRTESNTTEATKQQQQQQE